MLPFDLREFIAKIGHRVVNIYFLTASYNPRIGSNGIGHVILPPGMK